MKVEDILWRVAKYTFGAGIALIAVYALARSLTGLSAKSMAAIFLILMYVPWIFEYMLFAYVEEQLRKQGHGGLLASSLAAAAGILFMAGISIDIAGINRLIADTLGLAGILMLPWAGLAYLAQYPEDVGLAKL